MLGSYWYYTGSDWDHTGNDWNCTGGDWEPLRPGSEGSRELQVFVPRWPWNRSPGGNPWHGQENQGIGNSRGLGKAGPA